MLGISRWTEKGSSYRTMQRFFATDLPWMTLLVKFVHTHLFNPAHEYILAEDATTVIKSGSTTQKKQRKKARKSKKEDPLKNLQKRPEGVLNKNKKELNLLAELLRINELLSGLVKLLRIFVKVRYLAMDGHFGHNQAVLMTLSNELELVSKLRKDNLLYEFFRKLPAKLESSVFLSF